METLFCSIFGAVLHQNDLLKALCKTVEKDFTELHKCGITQCLHRLCQYVKLYMTVRIHHALKILNIGMTYTHKEIEKCLNCAINSNIYLLSTLYLHSLHIIFHQHLHTLHHSTHIVTSYIVQHGIGHLMGRTLASTA